MDKHAFGPSPSSASKTMTRPSRSLSATATAGRSGGAHPLSPTDVSGVKTSSHRQSRSVHHHRHLSRLSSGRQEQTLLDAVSVDGMADLSKKIGRLKEHTPSIHGSGHGHHHHKKVDNTAATTTAVGLERTREESEERQLAEWAVEAARETRRDECRNKEIRSALQGISEVSMETTRKLDDIYYSVLEKMSNVHSTINGLQELSNLTRKLFHGFENDAAGIQREIEEQTNTFGGFHTQKSRIESLEWRLKSSQDKTAILTDRLEAARERVQALENQEAEVQATISLRFRIFWGILGGAMMTLLALLILHNYTPPTDYSSMAPLKANSTVQVEVEEVLASLTGASMRSRPASLASLSMSTSPATSTGLEEDPRLRLFEEL